MISPLDTGRALADDPEKTSVLLWYLSTFSNEAWVEELSHQLQTAFSAGERAPVRELALRIAGACGEAE